MIRANILYREAKHLKRTKTVQKDFANQAAVARYKLLLKTAGYVVVKWESKRLTPDTEVMHLCSVCQHVQFKLGVPVWPWLKDVRVCSRSCARKARQAARDTGRCAVCSTTAVVKSGLCQLCLDKRTRERKRRQSDSKITAWVLAGRLVHSQRNQSTAAHQHVSGEGKPHKEVSTVAKATKKQAAKSTKGKAPAKGQTKAQRLANLEKARAARGTSPFTGKSLKELEALKAKSTDAREQSILRRYIRAARRAAGKPIPSEEKVSSKPQAKKATKPAAKATKKAAASKSKAKASTKAKGTKWEDEEDEDF